VREKVAITSFFLFSGRNKLSLFNYRIACIELFFNIRSYWRILTGSKFIKNLLRMGTSEENVHPHGKFTSILHNETIGFNRWKVAAHWYVTAS